MSSQAIECPSCGSHDVSSTNEIEFFRYGDADDAPKLSVTLPVHHCADCGLSYTGDNASVLRHEAVCTHLGVLNPREVRLVRESYGLSQAEFAEITRIGKASLSRWEGGLLVQNQANDNLLYLLKLPENLLRLKKRFQAAGRQDDGESGNVIPFRGKFRAVQESEIPRLSSEAAHFKLFPVAKAG